MNAKLFTFLLLFIVNVVYSKEVNMFSFYQRSAVQQWVFGILILESNSINELQKKTVASDLVASAFEFWYLEKNGIAKKGDDLSRMLEFHILTAMKNDHFVKQMNDPLQWNKDTRRIIGQPKHDWESKNDRKFYDALVLEFKNYFKELANQNPLDKL
jgi:hypothetical protein